MGERGRVTITIIQVNGNVVYILYIYIYIAVYYKSLFSWSFFASFRKRLNNAKIIAQYI